MDVDLHSSPPSGVQSETWTTETTATILSTEDMTLQQDTSPGPDKRQQEPCTTAKGRRAEQWATRIKKRKWRQSTKQKQRDADNSRILNLTLDVNGLRQQVYDYLVRKSLQETRLLVAREQFHSRSLQAMGQFFELFKHGFPKSLKADQQRFLDRLLDENMAVGGGVTGREEFLEQWRRYKELFCVRRLSNFTMKVISSDARGCLIECYGQFEGFVSTAALKTVFPHILNDETLVKRVLHRRFVCPTWTLINFSSCGRLVMYDASSDVFKAMHSLLEYNPITLTTLMADAMIMEGSMLPPVDDSYRDINRDNSGHPADYDNACESGNECCFTQSRSSSRNSIDYILCEYTQSTFL